MAVFSPSSLRSATKTLQLPPIISRASTGKTEAEVNELKERGFWFTSVNPFKHDKHEDWDLWSPYRQVVDRMVSNTGFEGVMGLFIMFQLVLAVQETDLIAQDGTAPVWVDKSNIALLVIYALEITLRLFATRRHFFCRFWNDLDLTVVSADIFVQLAAGLVGHFPAIATLRMLRLVRLARTFRAVKALHELQTLIHLMNGAFRALVSTFVILFVFFTICSIVAVELIQPIVAEVAANGDFGNCARCPRAFASVMQANLTWFQTIVLGDDWGQFFPPIIEHTPTTGFLFITITVIVALGMLNILMSVVVSKAEDARRDNQEEQLQEKLGEYEDAKKKLLVMCEELDTDKSGTLDLQELQEGMQSNEVFANAIRMLDIEPKDVAVVFQVLDDDNSGSVTYTEFVSNLHKMKTQDSHTLLVFIQHYCQQLANSMSSELALVRQEMATLDKIQGAVAGKTVGSYASEATIATQGDTVVDVDNVDVDDALSVRGVWSPLPSDFQSAGNAAQAVDCRLEETPSKATESTPQEIPMTPNALRSLPCESLKCANCELHHSRTPENGRTDMTLLLQLSEESLTAVLRKEVSAEIVF